MELLIIILATTAIACLLIAFITIDNKDMNDNKNIKENKNIPLEEYYNELVYQKTGKKVEKVVPSSENFKNPDLFKYELDLKGLYYRSEDSIDRSFSLLKHEELNLIHDKKKQVRPICNVCIHRRLLPYRIYTQRSIVYFFYFIR